MLIPAGVLGEIASADWIIRVHSDFDSYISDKRMQQWGFKRVKMLKEKSVYSLWQRTKRPTTNPGEPPEEKLQDIDNVP
jgi:hypothetical protein